MYDMYNEPAWTEENKNREYGSTNFSQCGWCEHASGTHRYSCCLSGSCSLLKSYDSDIKWDSDCKLKKLGKQDIEDVIKHKEYKISEYNGSVKRLEKQIELLNKMTFEETTVLPRNRKHDHFNIGDKVMMLNDFDGSLIRDRWVEGEVIYGYRHHDGCVSVKSNEKIHNGDYENGYGSGGGMSVPTIILKSEYEYFVKNPNKFKWWIGEACNQSFNGKTINSDLVPVPQ